MLLDTGGLFGASEDPLHELVVEQGQRAIVGADLLVMVVDGREGLVPGDERDRARTARRRARRCCSRSTRRTTSARARRRMEFFQLGFEPVIEISAEHGHGVAELLDEIVATLRATARAAPLASGSMQSPADQPGRAARRRASPSWAGPTSASRRW